MTTNTLTVSSTMDSLIGGLRSHLLGRSLPKPVVVSFYPEIGEISVQPEGACDLPRQLGNVLLWAYTLADVTAKWSHASGRLHVSVHGRTTSGARIQVYSGGPFAQCRGLVPLAAGESGGVSLDELYALVGLLREAHESQEVA